MYKGVYFNFFYYHSEELRTSLCPVTGRGAERAAVRVHCAVFGGGPGGCRGLRGLIRKNLRDSLIRKGTHFRERSAVRPHWCVCLCVLDRDRKDGHTRVSLIFSGELGGQGWRGGNHFLKYADLCTFSPFE